MINWIISFCQLVSFIDIPNPVKVKSFVTAIADEECAKIYAKIRKVPLESTHMCVINENNNDDCRGAGVSGGPLMSTLFNSSDFYAEGVISFSEDVCGESPVVATKVVSIMDWILSVIQP